MRQWFIVAAPTAALACCCVVGGFVQQWGEAPFRGLAMAATAATGCCISGVFGYLMARDGG